VQHGEWAGWVAKNCTFGIRESQRYMRAFHGRDQIGEQIRHGVSHLDSLRGAVSLVAEAEAEEKAAKEAAEEFLRGMEDLLLRLRSIKEDGVLEMLLEEWDDEQMREAREFTKKAKADWERIAREFDEALASRGRRP
jgi:hypothetical protein